MLGNRRGTVVTPPSTRCHMHGGCARIQQRSGRGAQRRPGGEHVIDKQNPAPRDTNACIETGTVETFGSAGARLCSRADPPQQPRRAHTQRLGGCSRQRLSLVKAARAAVSCRRRRPGDCVDARRQSRRCVDARRQSRRCVDRPLCRRCEVCEGERFAEPSCDGSLAPVLERMDELATDAVVREEQGDRFSTRYRRQLGIAQCPDALSARAPSQRVAARTAHFKQHDADRRCAAAGC